MSYEFSMGVGLWSTTILKHTSPSTGWVVRVLAEKEIQKDLSFTHHLLPEAPGLYSFQQEGRLISKKTMTGYVWLWLLRFVNNTTWELTTHKLLIKHTLCKLLSDFDKYLSGYDYNSDRKVAMNCHQTMTYLLLCGIYVFHIHFILNFRTSACV